MRSIFGLSAQHNFVSRLEGFSVPSGGSGDNGWTIELAAPALDGMIVFLDLNQNLHMRISEIVFANCPCTVTSLDMSYETFPWCANAGAESAGT